MKRTILAVLAALSLLAALAGCAQNGGAPEDTSGSAQSDTSSGSQSAAPEGSASASGPAAAGKRGSIPFGEGDLYAAAYLGYPEITDWDYYADRYLDSGDVPAYTVSDGEYYLVIPRYDGMDLALYSFDVESEERTLLQEESGCGPFIVRCNISDIFADAVICLTYQGETVEFSPFLSLENGLPVMGERGLDITKPGAVGPEYAADGEPDPFIGEYTEAESETPGLIIAPGEDGGYTVQIGIYRLASLEDGTGVPDGPDLRFTATDPNGNPIAGLIAVDGDTATVTFTDSAWEYLPEGTSVQYTRS